MEGTRPWELSDAVWERAGPLLPMHKPRPKGRRSPSADRQVLEAIPNILRTAIQWNSLSREIGVSTKVSTTALRVGARLSSRRSPAAALWRFGQHPTAKAGGLHLPRAG